MREWTPVPGGGQTRPAMARTRVEPGRGTDRARLVTGRRRSGTQVGADLVEPAGVLAGVVPAEDELTTGW